MSEKDSEKEAKKSEGVLKVGRQGRSKVQFAEGDPVFTIDVIETYNDFVELDNLFRLEDGSFDKARRTDYAKARWGFVLDIIKKNVKDEKEAQKMCDECSLADAYSFLSRIQEEVKRLTPFINIASDAKPSSPASSGTPVSYE